MSGHITQNTAHIHVAIATFQRPCLEDCLRSLTAQILPSGVRMSVLVADNDETPSAQTLVAKWAVKAPFPVRYIHAPARNIARARNACLEAATQGADQWIAFIDDDETAPPDWLARLYLEAVAHDLTAVFGPSRAGYPEAAPDWMRSLRPHDNIPKVRGSIIETGHTCNGLLRWHGAVSQLRFDEAYGRTGGEDTDFFFRAFRKGARFGLSDVAVEELVSSERLTEPWLMAREHRAGQSYARHARSTGLGRFWVSLSAFAKMVYCRLRMIGKKQGDVDYHYWHLRSAFHGGAASRLLGANMASLYGEDSPST